VNQTLHWALPEEIEMPASQIRQQPTLVNRTSWLALLAAIGVLAVSPALAETEGAGERIVEAKFLLVRGKIEQADALVAEVSVVKPSMETESVLRDLGNWHASKGEWAQAAALRLLTRPAILMPR
jgi:hypothetical protein